MIDTKAFLNSLTDCTSSALNAARNSAAALLTPSCRQPSSRRRWSFAAIRGLGRGNVLKKPKNSRFPFYPKRQTRLLSVISAFNPAVWPISGKSPASSDERPARFRRRGGIFILQGPGNKAAVNAHAVFCEVTNAQDGAGKALSYTAYQESWKPKVMEAFKTGKCSQNVKGENTMTKWVCKVCGYEYEGDELPADYVCPICGVGPDQFEK